MLLAVIALVLALGTPGQVAPQSILPPTQPGLSPDEGVFLATPADDGGQALYFVAQNVRHSILPADLQTEQQLNPLWPLRPASKDEVLAYPEGAPLGKAKAGRVNVPAAAAAAVPGEPRVAEGQPPTSYVLQPGDNLTRIARTYATTVEAILAANGLSDANRIYAGQALAIPSDASPAEADVAPAEPEAVSADSTPDEAVAADGVDTSYTVARGDSATGIARRFGVSTDALLAANGISNPNRVYVGQVLTIPAASS